MYQLWLTLHVLGAIGAFGFAFAAPIYGAMLAESRSTATGSCARPRGSRTSSSSRSPCRWPSPGRCSSSRPAGFARFSELWLALAVVIYVAAIAAVFLVQRPTLSRLIGLTSRRRVPAAVAGGPGPARAAARDRLRPARRDHHDRRAHGVEARPLIAGSSAAA